MFTMKIYTHGQFITLEKRMNRKSTLLSLVFLCMIVLSACASAAPTSTSSTTNNSSSGQAVDPANVTKVNLNTASGDDFVAAIPGLGNRMVREFMEYRPYISIQQFRQEIGKYVDEAQNDAYNNYIYAPIPINASHS